MFSRNVVLEILASLEKDGSDFALDTVKTLRAMCPVSLRVTREALRRGHAMSLADCLKMEYGMTQRFMRHSDFYEGVRAILVDKDRSPKWSNRSLEEVPDELVGSFFDPQPLKLDLN